MTLWSHCHACGSHWSTPRVTCPSAPCRRARRVQMVEDLAYRMRVDDAERLEHVAADVAAARVAGRVGQ